MAEPIPLPDEIGEETNRTADPESGPVRKNDTPDAGRPARPAPPERLAGGNAGSLLIMDDEQAILDLLSEMFGLAGFAVQTAGDGEEAVRLYAMAKDACTPFDITILDLTVRDGMGGKEAMLLIRKIDPDAIAIVSTGYSADPIMTEYRLYGFRAVLPKPYPFDEMLDLVTRLMRERDKAPDASADNGSPDSSGDGKTT